MTICVGFCYHVTIIQLMNFKETTILIENVMQKLLLVNEMFIIFSMA